MENKTYISQQEVNQFFSFLRTKELWNYYIIIYNLIYSKKTYIELQKGGLENILIPDDVPKPSKNPFVISISGVSKQLKIYQKECGIVGVNFSTRLFTTNFTMDGKTFYGKIPQEKTKQRKIDTTYLYIIKYVHRDSKVCNLLTDKKIGITYNMDKRLKQLTLGPINAEIIKSWKGDNRIIKSFEKMIHEKLKERNIIGEWFSDDDSNLTKIVEDIIKSKCYSF